MRTLEDYERLKEMSEDELKEGWREVSEETYWYFLEVLPPTAMRGGGFLVGEPITNGIAGILYDAGMKVNGRFFMRVASVLSFDPVQYQAEILARFFKEPIDSTYTQEFDEFSDADPGL